MYFQHKTKLAVWLMLLFVATISCAQEKRVLSISGYVDAGKCIDLEKLFDLYETANIRSNDDYTALFASARKNAALKIDLEMVNLQLHGNNLTKRTKADKNGRFRFDGLAVGEYMIIAETNSSTTPGAKKLTVSKLVATGKNSPVILHLDSEAVTVKGRLIDKKGIPIASGKIIVDDPRSAHHGEPSPWAALSLADGTFEIHGVPGVRWSEIMNYLIDPKKSLDNISMKILVTAKGFGLSSDFRNLKVPMISEDNVALAKRLIPVNNRILKQLGYPEITASFERTFPPSQGNTVMLGDIVLERK